MSIVNGLSGRRIVVTRSSDQAGDTERLVRDAGAIPVSVPLIEIVEVPDAARRLAAMDLDQFDWVVVTSPNGAAHVTNKLQLHRGPRVAAVGGTTAKTLPRCDLAPSQQGAAGLLDNFPDGPGRVLVVQAVDAAPTLVDGLRAKRWDVAAVAPYRSCAITPSDTARTEALNADAVLLASGSAARSWVAAFGTDAPPVVVAIGDQTAADATEAGLKITLVAADHSVYGMLVALGRYYSAKN